MIATAMSEQKGFVEFTHSLSSPTFFSRLASSSAWKKDESSDDAF